MKNRDGFTCGSKIKLAGGTKDESAKSDEYLEKREYDEELRTKVSLSKKKENYCVLVEAIDSEQNLVLGSGVLTTLGVFLLGYLKVENDTKENRCILTAAHCITDHPNGFVQKVSIF